MNLVIDYIEGFRKSKVMFTAAELGVFDRTPATAATLGGGEIERLLDACVSLGLLIRDGDMFRNTSDADRYLTTSSPESLLGYVLYSDRVLYKLWEHLDDGVREGTHRWQQAFGRPGKEIFDHFFATPEAMRAFLLGMHGYGMLSSPAVVAAHDLSKFPTICDLGGGTGHLVAAACARYPAMRGILFDLPKVVEIAAEFIGTTRIDRVAGDFFTDPFPPADLYAVCRILHDWTEEKISLLLRKIRATGGSVLIAERLIAPDRSGPVSALLQSLNMLLCTEGKERTLAEYTALLNAAGFTRVRGVVTGVPHDAILAEP